MCGDQNSWFFKVSLRICYISLFDCKGLRMLKTVINLWNRGLQNYTEEVSYTVLLNYLHTFVLNIFLVFNTLYLHNCFGYWQVLFIV